MWSSPIIPPLLVALSLTGCDAKLVGTQVATDFKGEPHRVFVIDAIDKNLGASVSTAFRAGIRAALTSCGIASADFKPDAMELDNARRGNAELAAFNPDLLLRIETRRARLSDYTESITYWVGAREASHGQIGRQVWSTALATTDFLGSADREVRGTGMAAKVVERMATDGILPGCAHPPPTVTGAQPPYAPPR